MNDNTSTNDGSIAEDVVKKYAENSAHILGESIDRDSVKITIPKPLLQEIDSFCEAFSISRSNFISGAITQTLYPNFVWQYNISLWKQKLYFFKMKNCNTDTILNLLQSGVYIYRFAFSIDNSPSTALFLNVQIDSYDEKYVYITTPDSWLLNKFPGLVNMGLNTFQPIDVDHEQIDRGDMKLVVPTFFDNYVPTSNIRYKVPLEYVWVI